VIAVGVYEDKQSIQIIIRRDKKMLLSGIFDIVPMPDQCVEVNSGLWSDWI